MYSQVQLNKQIQDQGYSYGVIGNIFSALEWYAYRISGISFSNQDIIFNGYNNFNCGNQKELEDLKNQIITQIEIFKFSYQVYIKDHKKYDFPNNLSKKDMINLLMKWKSIIPDSKEHRFYDAMIEIINGNFNISLINEVQKKIENEGKDGTKIDPNIILQAGTKVVNYSQQMGDQIMKDYENNPNFKPEMKLGKDNPSDLQIKQIGDDYNLLNSQQSNLENRINQLFYYSELFAEDLKIETQRKFYRPQNLPLDQFCNKVNEDFSIFLKELDEYQKKFNTYYYKNNPEEINNLCIYINNISNLIQQKQLLIPSEYMNQFNQFIQILNELKNIMSQMINNNI